MTGSVLVVHPEAEQLDRIQTLLQPLALEIRRASGFLDAREALRARTVDLVVGADIPDIPQHDPRVVEGIRRVTSRLPIIVLLRHHSQKDCPRATLLLTGLQQYLVWPQEAADLPAVARALLRTSRYLNGSHQDHLAAMRDERDSRRMRETLNALRVTGGNISQAAEILKMSRSGLNYRLKQLGLR
jgi:DNA-binding NtrC family response regulator